MSLYIRQLTERVKLPCLGRSSNKRYELAEEFERRWSYIRIQKETYSINFRNYLFANSRGMSMVIVRLSVGHATSIHVPFVGVQEPSVVVYK